MDNDVLSAEVCTRLSADINLCAFSGNKELEYGAFLYGKEKKPNIIYFDIPSKHDDYEPSFRKIEVNTDKNGNELKFLNTGEYNNENDNSSVIYFNYNNYKFLFMGDAGINRENDILVKYNLPDIDFLKVGHHGYDTSSSEKFIILLILNIQL